MSKIQEVIEMLEQQPNLAWLAWEAKNLRRFAKAQEVETDDIEIPTNSLRKHSLADTIENIESSILCLGLMRKHPDGDGDLDFELWDALDALEIELVTPGPNAVFKFTEV